MSSTIPTPMEDAVSVRSTPRLLPDEAVCTRHSMIGESDSIRRVVQCIAKVAPTDSTVLILGESGTGKELAAQAIHLNSARAGNTLVAINCAALTEPLLESELFGHEKGSFTGATAQTRGKLEAAHGGTLFLDEVAELPPVLQAKLLRVLETQKFERVGGTRPINVDIRLIAATNRDPDQALRTGVLRQDLYFRLNVLSLTMPPLRERREDIPLLASHFVEQYRRKLNRRPCAISPETLFCLMRYDWPGNVRELKNAIERALVLVTGDIIRAEDLPEAVLETRSPTSVSVLEFHQALREAKKQVILQALKRSNGNYTEAAKILRIHPNHLHRVIRQMNLRTWVRERAQ